MSVKEPPVGSRQETYFEAVEEALKDSGTVTGAIEKVAEQFGTTPGNVQGAYYRVRKLHRKAMAPNGRSYSRHSDLPAQPATDTDEVRQLYAIAEKGVEALGLLFQHLKRREDAIEEKERTLHHLSDIITKLEV